MVVPVTTNGVSASAAPTVRELDDATTAGLAGLVEVFEDLQTSLRCCERLVTELAVDGEPDQVVVEAVWTLTLLCYARCFAADKADAALTTDDLSTVQPGAEVLEWHRLLLQLRDHHADPAVNPREQFSVGVAQGEDGRASGVAITSARQPLVDDLTVRQTGAIAYALSGLVNQRIESRQAEVFERVRGLSADELTKLSPLDVSAPAEA